MIELVHQFSSNQFVYFGCVDYSDKRRNRHYQKHAVQQAGHQFVCKCSGAIIEEISRSSTIRS